MDLMSYYPWLKAAHLVAVMVWMVGLLYLPRIFVHHARVQPGSEADDQFKMMERGLLRVALNPAMIAAFLTGILLIVAQMHLLKGGWLHTKLLLVVLMAGLHGMMSKYRKDFARGQNLRTEGFYKGLNKIPGILMALAVLLAVLKPF